MSSWSQTRKIPLLQRVVSSTSFLFRGADSQSDSTNSDNDNDISSDSDFDSDDNHHEENQGANEKSPLLRISNKNTSLSMVSEHETLDHNNRGYKHRKSRSPTTVQIRRRMRPRRLTKSEQITFTDSVRGAFVWHIPPFCCFKEYSLRVYLHYWLWQIPILFLNIGLFCIWLQSRAHSPTQTSLSELGYLAVGPVLCAALIRDKIFLWVVYGAVKKTLHWRTFCFCCTKILRYHISRGADCIGGLHSSAGATALLWNVVYCGGCLVRENWQINWRTGTAISLPVLLLIICLSALPCIRHHYHNSFEIIHRYLSWLCLSLLITHVTFVNIYQQHSNMGSLVNPTTLFTFGIFVLTVYPWLILHCINGSNVDIRCGAQATAYIFPFSAPMGAVTKMSTDCMEFHIMGITPLKDGRSFVLCKSLGDWTANLNQRASVPGLLHDTTFYISRIKPPNFTQGLFNWNRVFVLCTGSGIAPLIPYVVNPLQKPIISLVWVARDHAVNYPKFLIDILEGIDNCVLYDTTKMPRPNLCTLTLEYAHDFDAEAVFLVSNPTLAYEISNYVTKHGIPVFASNFDV